MGDMGNVASLPAITPGNLPMDWITVGIVFLVLAIDLYRSGPTRSASLALGSLIALPLYQLLGKTIGIGAAFTALPGVAHAVVFAGLVVLCYVFLSRMVLPFSPGGSFLQTLFGALSTSIILLAVVMQIPPLVDLWHPSLLLTTFFAEPYLIFWIVLSLAVLAFTSL